VARLIYSVIMSLDGYIADKKGNFDWAEPDEKVHSFINELERPVGTYLYGRRMYEVMAVWQTMQTHDEPSCIAEFANIWRAADKVVYSTTLKTASTPRTSIEHQFEPSRRNVAFATAWFTYTTDQQNAKPPNQRLKLSGCGGRCPSGEPLSGTTWRPVSIREWMSTLKDDPSPDKESMNQVAMATVIGLVAGLAISALIVVSHDLMTVSELVSPRVLFGSALAALLTTTAFGRGRIHFAKRALYDFPLLALDIVMIIAAAALVGLMTRSSFSFDGWAWGWLAVALACQLVRNLRLGSQRVTGLRLGILCLILGLTANIGILLFAPADEGVAAVASVAALILIAVQFWREVITPFR